MSMLRISAFAMTTAMLWAAPQSALGQAWVPVKNSLSASLDYSYGPSDRVVESGDAPDIDVPGLANHTVALGAEYTPPVKNLAVTVSVPIVTTKFDVDSFGGGSFLLPHGSYDDGDFHTVLQDFRAILRYQVLPNNIVAVAPHIGISTPMSRYETLGFAGAGRGLDQLHLGVGIGRYFVEGPLANFYLHVLFEYTIGERYKTEFVETEEYNQNRMDLKGIIGYFINDNLEVNLGFDMRQASGGFEFVDFQDVPVWIQRYHDPLLKESFLLLGGGVTYEVIEGLRLNAVFRYWTTGENTRDTHILGGGVAWDIM